MRRRLAALLGLLLAQIFCELGLSQRESPSWLSVQEGASPTLNCTFSASVRSVQWFQQNPGSSLISLFFISSGTKQNRRLKATVNSQERYSTLHITTTQVEDSGTYLCAAEAQ
uniref:Ig-like domain-containing protein n=1 Tax=Oryctolagus cuniculus TaxID=9986 RepID=G1TJE4_RABIT